MEERHLIFILLTLLVQQCVTSPVWMPQFLSGGTGRNIRHLPCVSRRTGDKGTCMFAIHCMKANGTHLGTCIDRFYFGSCCRLNGPELLDQDNNESNHLPVLPPSKVTTERARTTTSKRIPLPQGDTEVTTEGNYQLSTFQSVQDNENTVGVDQLASGRPDVTVTSSSTTTTAKPTKTTEKPTKPTTVKPKPTYQKPTTTHQKPTTTHPKPTTTHQKPTTTYQKPTTPQRTTTTTPTPKPTKPSQTPPKPTKPQSDAATTTKTTTYRPVTTKPTTPKTTTTTAPVKKPSPTKKPTLKPTTSTDEGLAEVSLITKPSSGSQSKPSTSTTTPKPVRTTTKPVTAATTANKTTARPTTKPTTKPTAKPTKPATKPTTKPTTQTQTSTKPTTKPAKPASTTAKPTKTTTTTTTAKPTRPSPTPAADVTVKPTTSQKPSTDLLGEENEIEGSTKQPSTSPGPGLVTWTSLEGDGQSSSVQTTTTSKPFSTTTSSTTTTAASTTTTETTTLSTSSTSSGTTSMSTDSWVLIPDPTPPPMATAVTDVSHPSTTLGAEEMVTEEQLPMTSVEPSALNMSDYTAVCGRRLYPEARIVGGEKASFGKWPWQISLRQWRTSTYLHKCGAALLNENWAITAAHCVENVPPNDLLLRLGEHDLSTEDEPYGYQERRVQIVASHPQFDPRTFEYDLALLRFYEPVAFQPNILPVCVPQDDTNFVGKTAHVTGWGRLYEDGPLPSMLQEVSVPVINNTVCETMYRSAGYIEHIPEIFICAGWQKGGFDSCEGDSGGPMVIQRPDRRWLLAGIISWGIGCAEPNQPGVYTRISQFREWINQILQF